MSFLDNMPSLNADNFALLLSGGVAAGASRQQARTAVEYCAVNDTRPPPEGQVMGICQGHSVLGQNWQPPLADKRGMKRPAPASGGTTANPWASAANVPQPIRDGDGVDERTTDNSSAGVEDDVSNAHDPDTDSGVTASSYRDWRSQGGAASAVASTTARAARGRSWIADEMCADGGQPSVAGSGEGGEEVKRRSGRGGGIGAGRDAGTGEGGINSSRRGRAGKAKARRTYGRR